MALKRDRSLGGDNKRLALLFNSTMADYSYIENASPGEIVFDKGAGQSYVDASSDGNNYGEWLIIPQVDFEAEVKMWGAGGGAHGSTSDSGAGGGGFAKATIQFYKGMPYIVCVPETGHYTNYTGDRNASRYSGRFQGGWPNGGGACGAGGGGGGGSAGIFFDAGPTLGGPGAMADNAASTFHGAGQPTALLMAGGGGGMGHHGNSHHGTGGGGGGTNANAGHAQGPSSQVWGGHVWQTGNQGVSGIPYHGGISGPSTTIGAGGGGWWGGAGGTHGGTNHHNGGSGGTGHSLEQSDQRQPNIWIRDRYPDIVTDSYLETAPTGHNNRTRPIPAGTTDPDWNANGSHEGHGGGHNNTYTPSSNRGNNGRVLIRFKK